MRWTDTGILLTQKSLGESSVVLTILTQSRGLHKGLARRSGSKPLPQPGTLAHVAWSGRLSEHLGTWTLEPTFQPMATILDSPLKLNALTAACSLIEATLPEREPSPGAYQTLHDFLYSLSEEGWETAYLSFERSLLKLMGYELNLKACAATGQEEDLIYISPKSGRAVSREAGAPYKETLFPLSSAFVSSDFSQSVFWESLNTLGFFWEKYVLHPHGTSLPPARDRFLSTIKRRAL